VLLPGGPAVALRRFRFTGRKCYGWDTFLVRQRGECWGAPEQLSPAAGQPDARYAVLADGDELLGFHPACDQRPTLTFAEEAAGEPGSGRTGFASNHRVEVWSGRTGEAAATAPDLPRGKEAFYVIPPPMPAPAPDPPELEEPPEGLHLVWGDLHAHSAYSKCMGANDGLPGDVLRLQRDVLGCRVLCLTEHVEYMSAPEFAHVLDEVEREAAGGAVCLYGVEWAKRPAHHTNIYAVDRVLYDRLRALMLSCDHLSPLYERIRDEFGPARVTAVRHMHGMNSDEFGISGARTTETHDPEMERAMEAMQTRGNMMLSYGHRWPRFPNNFLDAGAKVGLVGGSDHSRGGGPNRFCLTGFWVPELTPRAVLEALRERRTVAVSNGKVAIHATLNGVPFGGEVSVQGEVRVRAQLAAAHPVRRAALMRDGEILQWQEVGAREATLELLDPAPEPGRHWYVVTAEADSSAVHPPALAHASPFFVTVGGGSA
jgi:hypothetical protein